MEKSRILAAWALLALLAAIDFALFAVPLYAVIPLRAQTERLLRLAYLTTSITPVVSAIALVFASSLAFFLWRNGSLRSRLFAAAFFAPVLAAAVLARVNYLEWIFPPASRLDIARIDAPQDIDAADLIIGVVSNGETRAYPVRYLAHHHMVNDRLGSIALLPTY